MGGERLYGVKMRASLGGVHVSGAERIVDAKRIAPTLSALARRALGHERGVPDSINLKVEAQSDVLRIKALPVTTFTVADAAEGWAKVAEILSVAGFVRTREICGLFKETYSMRGAMLLDADTLERLEPDRERGVRATNMDSEPSPPADHKNHFIEALALASKVLAAPGIVGEVCVSDDPEYVTGYVATPDGYHRITVLKKAGDPSGGRIFLYRGPRDAVGATIRFLEKQAVVVECPPAPCATFEASLAADIAAIDAAGLRRRMRTGNDGLVSFADNDYLGLANDLRVKDAAAKAAMDYGAGAGASRLVTGTLPPHLSLERHLAAFKGAEDAIVFSTGYMANLGAISALVGKGDVVLSDALNHASIIDGCRLSGAEVVVYPHLDMDALGRLLSAVGGARRVLVVSDGVFSMDGDILDLPRFVETCRRHGAFSMVDEAHALGVVGQTGRGLAEHFGCGHPDVMMGTLSKALGSSGGYVAGSATLVEYLRQKSRPFIFNTAPTPASAAAADAALSLLEREPRLVEKLHANVAAFASATKALAAVRGGESAIFPVVVGDERKAVAVSEELERRGFLVPAIRYPTVARCEARLRVAVSARHTAGQIASFASAVKSALGRMKGLLAAVCLAAASAAPQQAFSAAVDIVCDYYVSQATGNDQNPGVSTNAPFKTIDAALSVATNGQSVGVMAGSYPYPDYYATSSYNTGASRRMSLCAIDGPDSAFIDASLGGGTAAPRIVGSGDGRTLFSGFTFRGCRSNTAAMRFAPYCYVYFKDCSFEHIDTTNQNGAATWCGCVLDGCVVQDFRVTGTGGSQSSNPANNPSIFWGSYLYDCYIAFTNEGSNVSLSSNSTLDNCFVYGGTLQSMEISMTHFHVFSDCTLLISGLKYPNGWSDYGWYDDKEIWQNWKPVPLDGCLVGIDGYTNTYFVTDTYVTNFAATSMIDFSTLRVADSASMAYYYGYNAREDRLEMQANARPRTLTWNGGESGRFSSQCWSGGVGLHITPYTGDTLVFPKGGRFVNDIGGLVLGGLVFDSTVAVTLAGGLISLLDDGPGVTVAGTGPVTVETPLCMGFSVTSTVPVSVCSGGSLRIGTLSGDANVLFGGPGSVALETAASSKSSFVMSNAVSVVLHDDFAWGGPELAIIDGSALTVTNAVAISEDLAISLSDRVGRTGVAGAASRLVLGVDIACDYMTVNGSIRAGKKTYGSALSEAEIKDDKHFGGTGTIYVRHPTRFSMSIW